MTATVRSSPRSSKAFHRLGRVAAVLLAACGEGAPEIVLVPPPTPAVTCETACGIHSEGFLEGCGELQRAERAVREAFRSLYSEADTCDVLRGLRLYVVSDELGEADGMYSPPDHAMWLSDRIPIADGPFGHEVAHALDAAYHPDLQALDWHYDWGRYAFALQAYWIIMDRPVR